MRITSIKQQVKNPERASIFVDGTYSFSLSLDELVRERLKNGQELDEAQLKTLKRLSDEGKLRMKALNWILLRPHSEREFRDYLYRKKAEKELIDTFVDEFKQRTYIDDENFARWWFEQRASANRSDRYIRAELIKKGVSREIIDELLSSIAEHEVDEMTRLKNIINKKRSLPRYRDDPRKLMQYLARQGFGYDDIKRTLAEEN